MARSTTQSPRISQVLFSGCENSLSHPGKIWKACLGKTLPRNCQLYITINYIDMKTNCLNMIICVFSLVCAHIDLCIIRGPPASDQPFIRLSWRIKPGGEEGRGGGKMGVCLGCLPCRNLLIHTSWIIAFWLCPLAPSLGCTPFQWTWAISSSPVLEWERGNSYKVSCWWLCCPPTWNLAKMQGWRTNGGTQRTEKKMEPKEWDWSVVRASVHWINASSLSGPELGFGNPKPIHLFMNSFNSMDIC